MTKGTKKISWIFAVLLMSIGGPRSAMVKSVDDGSNHDLAAARVMDRAILAVMEDYYDTSRMDPEKMFKGALDAIQRQVAEIRVVYSDDGIATIHLLDRKLPVLLSETGSPWGLSLSFRRIFRFVQEHLPREAPLPNYRTIEYAAVNGLLSTLDPHTSAMTPDIWEELRMSTRGEFEGIGIRITTDHRAPCDGNLTVVDVFEGTPAKRAGLKAGDQILRIDGNATVNITTGEAADQLRGKPGTSVKVEIRRKDGTRRTMDIVRQRIPIESVKWKMLDSSIGYIEFTSFQNTSADEMTKALGNLHDRGMQGLIIDLRGNPGGLLDAAIEIADMFVSAGTLVTTAGGRRSEREVRNAVSRGTEPDYPMAILIDGYTASAGEILSGSLRHHGRAILIGDTSFGKGSVQSIIPLPDEGAMRMTIQQYLIPGDISIQAVGVSPDVFFHPIVVHREEMSISMRERDFSEASLDAHLGRVSEMERGDRIGAISMQYFVSAQQRHRDLERLKRCYPDNPDDRPYRYEWETRFASRLLAAASGTSTPELLVTARELVETLSPGEIRDVTRSLRTMGVDWNLPVTAESILPAITMTPSAALSARAVLRGSPVAGKKIRIEVVVTNESNEMVHHVRARTKSDNPALSGLELVFGRLPPGKSARWAAVAEIPPTMSSRVDPVEVVFFSHEGIVPHPVSLDVTIAGRILPELVYNWSFEDLGNGNGLMESQERFRMVLHVRNEGRGATFRTVANLSARGGVSVESGQVILGELKPGAAAQGSFEFTVSSRAAGMQPALTLSFEEWVPFRLPSLISLQQQVIPLPIVDGVEQPVEEASGTIMVLAQDVPLYLTPDKNGQVIARVAQDDSFRVNRHIGSFFGITVDGRQLWIPRAHCRPGGKGDTRPALFWSRLPLIRFDTPTSLLLSSDAVQVSGHVSHPRGLRDLIVFSGDTKLEYYQIPDRSTEYAFSFRVALSEGTNRISVVARHDGDTVSSRSLMLRRTDGSGR